MSNEIGPWVVRRSVPAQHDKPARIDYLNEVWDESAYLWHEGLAFAHRFVVKRDAIRAVSDYLKREPSWWGSLRIVRLVRKVAP